MKILYTTIVFLLFLFNAASGQQTPLKVGVIGLSHSHVHWIFNSDRRDEITIVGIVESNKELVERYTKQYNFPKENIFNSMDELIEARHPEAVTAFGPIYDHLMIVQTCAPKGIHIMVEKPLAVNLKHAEEMAKLARDYNIKLLTNYETTWYPTTHKAYELTRTNEAIGKIRKIIIRDGHKGPKKIGVDKEFLEWLTDPELNGGGALTDFGCYGANLATWLMNGEKPKSVTAVTQQLQKENNPEVDDEANLILVYENATVIIQASWNWPIGRKDMEIYGLKGVIYADNGHDLRVRIPEGYDGFTEDKFTLQNRKSPMDDPFAFLNAVVKEQVVLQPYDLSSLENNLIVMEILDAAAKSAKQKKTIQLN